MNTQKLSQTTWFTILMLFIFFPVGIYLMWKNKKFKHNSRIIITALILGIAFIPSNDSDSDSQTTISKEQVVGTQLESITDTEDDITKQDNKEVSQNDVAVSQDKSDTQEKSYNKTEDATGTDSEKKSDNKAEEAATTDSEKTLDNKTEDVAATDSEKSDNKIDNGTFKYKGKSYKIIEVDGGDLSGSREANVAVDIGFGDRTYWALTNEYGQLVYVMADKITLQDDKNEPVTSKGRYYSDEAKVPGVERSDLDEGHIIADSLGGVSNAYNITPQESTLNRHGDQAYMEKVIRDAGGCENFVATITYPNTTTQIPSKYKYTYTLKGNKIVDEFDNVNPDKVNSTINSKNNVSSKNNTSSNTSSSDKASTNKKEDLSKVDTNGNGKVTIAEAKAAGYSMPIYSDHWLYKYMDDRDGDGVVGE
ncbi:DNA/RNA non-specific endonuclease [Anaerosporobacter sp.]